MFKKSTKFWDILGEILAVVLVLLYVVLIINANFTFIPDGAILNVLNAVKSYGSLALIAIVYIEFVAKRNLVLQIIFILLLALVVIFLFFPDTFTYLVGIVPRR